MAKSWLVGKKVVNVRLLTPVELAREGWGRCNVTAIEFTGGNVIYASRDEEGNGPGTFFGCDKTGGQFYLLADAEKED